MARIKEVGGTVHYSQEMRVYLASLPKAEAERICREIEHRNRPRKIIVHKPDDVAAFNSSEERQKQ